MQIKDRHTIGFSAIILAGGLSSRMGYPKAWLPFNDSFSFLQNIATAYLNLGCSKVIVVLNKHYYSGFEHFIALLPANVEIVVNEAPMKGRIHSLQLGIKTMGSSELTVIQNVDNPYVSESVIKSLLSEENSGYVKPIINGKSGHPIVVTQEVLNSIMESPFETNLRDLLKTHSCVSVQVDDPSILCNINNAEQYESLFQRKVPVIN